MTTERKLELFEELSCEQITALDRINDIMLMVMVEKKDPNTIPVCVVMTNGTSMQIVPIYSDRQNAIAMFENVKATIIGNSSPKIYPIDIK
jgi:hypothetical protein